MAEIEPREFRVAAWYRRSVLSATVFYYLFLASVGVIGQNRFWGIDFDDGIAALALTCIAVVTFRWRIRVDPGGIKRRRFRRWTEWKWEVFQGGEIYRGVFPDSFRDPRRRWGDRTLLLTFLSEPDRDFLSEVCNRLWVPPARPEIPDEITFQYPKDFRFSPFRGEIKLSPDGLRWKKRSSDHFFSWNEVQELEIVRAHHDHPDFDQLKLMLPKRTIRLAVVRILGFEDRNWAGASPNLLATALESYVPSERIRARAYHGPPRTLEEVEQRMTDRRWDARFHLFRLVGAAAIIAVIVYSTFRVLAPVFQLPVPVGGQILELAKMAGMFLVFAVAVLGPNWAIYQFKRRYGRREIGLLEQWRDEMLAAETEVN